VFIYDENGLKQLPVYVRGEQVKVLLSTACVQCIRKESYDMMIIYFCLYHRHDLHGFKDLPVKLVLPTAVSSYSQTGDSFTLKRIFVQEVIGDCPVRNVWKTEEFDMQIVDSTCEPYR